MNLHVGRQRFSFFTALLALLLTATFAFAQPISDQAQAQIAALLAEKDARTPAQRKIDSRLLATVKMNRGEPIADGVPRLETGLESEGPEGPVVDVTAVVSETLLETIARLGGEVLDSHATFRSVRARLPLGSVEALAADPAVVFIQPKQEAETWREISLPPGRPTAAAAAVSSDVRRTLGPGFEERAERVRAQLSAALARREASDGGRTAFKTNSSEGDVTHRADLARANFGVNGAGVKVGVLSDGVDFLAAVQASGDLPAVHVLPGQAGGGDEGTAMLEIVHDLAPGAQLYFASAFGGIASFAQNILDLRAAGCDIIVDDVFYFVETPFQKGQAPSLVTTTNGGLVIEAVNTVTAAGALYFSSAGNSGNKNDATSGTWEGDFADGGAVAAPITGTGNLHDFGGGQAYDVLTTNGSGATLHWSDPLAGSSNDYDLFRLDAAGTAVVSSSTNVQSGTQDPWEFVTTAVNARIVVVKRTGAAARFLHLDTLRGRLSLSTSGSTHGHSAPPGLYAFGVAATPAVGPFPLPFGPANVVETFSSDGFRRYFFNADSTAITPGNFLATGGEVQNKPDLTAADGVSCAAPGFNPFYGTSAAAPHAAAIAALVKSAAPSATQAQLRSYLLTGIIDIEGGGTDRDSGLGILDALSAVTATGIVPGAFLSAGTPAVAEASGDGDGLVEPGECASLSVPLVNTSTATGATAVSAVLSTSTPGVTIDVGASAYPAIGASATASNVTDFQFRLATSVPCPLFVDFVLTVTFSGGQSPVTRPIRVRVGAPAVVVSTVLDGTAPPASPGVYVAATGTQTGRINRFSPASMCGISKANPGLFSPGGLPDTVSRLNDSYTFQNCSANSACIDVIVDHPSFNSPGGNQVYAVAYSPSFDPTNPALNFVADSGASGANRRFAFTAAPGQTFVIVVHEVNAGVVPSYPYTLTVDGACFPCTTYSTTYSCCPSGSLTVTAPAAVGSGSPNRVASVPNNAGSTYAWIVTNGSLTGGQGTSQITFTAGASGSVGLSVTETKVGGCQQSGNATVPIGAPGAAVLFYTVPPCRVLDTRAAVGTYGGPALQPSATRAWALASQCGIPADARAVSANITVVSPALPGFLTLFPGGTTRPLASSINYSAGQTRANNVILPVSADGTATFNAFTGSTGTVHFLFDVNGFVR